MNSIPVDLIDEIFSRLPAKSIGRSRCVSELWRSILFRPDFTELFLTRSPARPRLLFAMHGVRKSEWSFFSAPQPRSPYEKLSSLVVAADFQLKSPKRTSLHFCGRASGLFCFRQTSFSTERYEDTVHVICNPSIGTYSLLPKLRRYRNSESFLGFDPIDKIFKVLSTAHDPYGGDGNILSLGTGTMRWRKIQYPLTQRPFTRWDYSRWSHSKEICINGFLYYLVQESDKPQERDKLVMVCFDVRLEKFNYIHAEFIKKPIPQLINYKGKLGVIKYHVNNELCVWVLEDIEKQEWSKYAYTFPNPFEMPHVVVVGVTATGEIVLSNRFTCKPFYVFYFNPESTTRHRVEIQGIHGQMVFGCQTDKLYTFVDYAEDLTFNMKAHQQEDRFKSINKFDALSLLNDV